MSLDKQRENREKFSENREKFKRETAGEPKLGESCSNCLRMPFCRIEPARNWCSDYQWDPTSPSNSSKDGGTPGPKVIAEAEERVRQEKKRELEAEWHQLDKDLAHKMSTLNVGADPWAHRSAKMRCKTCMFFVPKESSFVLNDRLGRCRRHAPTVGSGWPAVFESDWCGDHKLDEGKI